MNKEKSQFRDIETCKDLETINPKSFMLTSMLCTLNELIISILYCLAFTLQVRRAIKEDLLI